MPINGTNGRTLAGVAAELKDELKEFVNTRLAMLQSELKEKISVWKMALPTIVLGLVLLGTAWLLLTGAVVAAIYVAFAGNPFAAAIALAILGVVYAVGGGMAAVFAVRELKENSPVPKRTMRVLKDDQLWIRNEARVQL
ncbi:MAG: phage holin family protein [Terriglobales bacterium]